MLPTEMYHYIVSKMDGFERENMRLVCKMFNGFRFVINSKNPARDREVLLIDCNRRFYELFEYGHLDIIKQCYRRYGNYRRTIEHSCRYGFTEFAMRAYEEYCVNGEYRDNVMVLSQCLWKAAIGGHFDTMKMVIRMGAQYYSIATKVICEKGNIEMFKYMLTLIKFRPSMDDFICEACSSGNIDMVRLVIGFRVKYSGSWDSGLRSACYSGNMDIIRLMIDNGASDWDFGFYGACEGGHINIAKMMIAYGATDILNITPTCEGGNIDILKMQIEMGANNFKDGFNIAVSNGHFNIVKMLAASCEIKYSLCHMTKDTGIEIIEFLINNGAEITNFVLRSAIEFEDLNIVKLLIKHRSLDGINIYDVYSDKRIMKYLESC